MRKPYWGGSIVAMVLMAACHNAEQPAPRSPSAGNVSPSDNPTTPPATDKWLGQWNGPEGTYLVLSKDGDKYSVKIQSLNGAETYQGVPAGDRIQFKRDGSAESIHAGSGDETGMKWLLGKKNCLIVRNGEGFCRD